MPGLRSKSVKRGSADASASNNDEQKRFPATRWTLVRNARGDQGDEQARKALSELAEMYREPVLAYFTGQGRTPEQATALAEEFFEALKQRKTLNVGESGVRFRVWLLSALKDFALEKEQESPAQAERPSEAAEAVVNDSEPAPACPRCGARLSPNDRAGTCPVCLLSTAIEPEPSSDEPGRASDFPKQIGGYQIIDPVDEGGMGEVYRARQPGSDHVIALKVLKSNLLRYTDVVERFRKAVEIAGRLEHPNIVRVYDRSGLYDESPFYTMQFVAGGALADSHCQERFRDARRAAKLMIQIARAVQFAHEHGVLHLDLKPENILLDGSDQPYVCDFMAKRIDRRAERIGRRVASSIVGTIAYMAPEQAAGEGATTAVDVYGLGAIFYELLTGRPPVPPEKASTLDELLEHHKTQPLVSPRQLVPGLDRELEAICLAALDKEPGGRFRSAAEFAESLERVLRYEPPLRLATPRHRRLMLWARRHPLLAFTALLGTVLLLLTDAAMLFGARSEQQELRNATLRNNSALASAQARVVLAVLKKYVDYTLSAASQPGVRDVLASGPSTAPAAALQDIYERAGSLEPEAVYLVSANGTIVSRWPMQPIASIGKDYSFRDYYRCAKALAALNSKEVCIAPAYRSDANNVIQMAFSSPVYDANGTWVGVLVISRGAGRKLEDIELNAYHSDQMIAVFAGRGSDRYKPASRQQLIAVLHPELHSLEEHFLKPDLAQRLIREFSLRMQGGHVAHNDARPLELDDYTDELSSPTERLLASFAPVGETGYVVVVATPYQKAIGPNQRLIHALFTYGVVLNLSFLVIAGIAVWTSLRGARRPEG